MRARIDRAPRRADGRRRVEVQLVYRPARSSPDSRAVAPDVQALPWRTFVDTLS